jgi:hypothetical protein
MVDDKEEGTVVSFPKKELADKEDEEVGGMHIYDMKEQIYAITDVKEKFDAQQRKEIVECLRDFIEAIEYVIKTLERENV